MDSPVHIACWIANVVGVLLIVSLLIRKENKLANHLLAFAIFNALVSYYIATWLWMGIAEDDYSHYFLRVPFVMRLFNIGVIYLYILAMTVPDFRLQRRQAKHFIPFVMGLAWYLLVLWKGKETLFYITPEFYQEYRLRLAFVFCIEAFYAYLIYRRILILRDMLKNSVSNMQRYRLTLAMGFFAIIMLFVILHAVVIVLGPELRFFFIWPVALAISLVFLAIFALQVSPVFSELPKTPMTLSPAELQKYALKLRECIDKERPYLNPELRLVDLADMLHMKPYRVSEVIKNGLATTFYDMINERRVVAAKEKLADLDNNHLNILAIATESGFNSKSAFNEIFKKFTGMTPSDFRERGLKS